MIDQLLRDAGPTLVKLIAEIVRAVLAHPTAEGRQRAAARALAAVASEEASEAVLKNVLGRGQPPPKPPRK